MRDEINLRSAIAAVFILLVMLPVLFITAGLQQMNAEAMQKRLNLLEQDLKNEARSFQADLNARQHVEKILKRAERRAGLSSASLEKPAFVPGVDPGIFTKVTIPEMLGLYRELADVEPLMMICFSADIYDIWSWFSKDLSDIQPADRSHLGFLLSIVAAEQRQFVQVDARRDDAASRFSQTLRLAAGAFDGPNHAYFKVMGRLFSDMIYQLPFQGACYETATRKRGDCRLFSYYRRIKQGPKIMGGYFVTFASRHFPPEKLLADALQGNSPGFLRQYLHRMPEAPGKTIARARFLQLETSVPAELTGYNSLFSQPALLPAGLRVSFDISEILSETAVFSRALMMMQQLALLFCLTLSCYFVLFGFPARLRLRLRMLLSVSLAVIMPYTILGHVSMRLLGRIESLSGFELRADAESEMQKLHGYYNDQRQQHLLQTLKVKKNLMSLIDRPQSEIMSQHAWEVVPEGTNIEASFFRNDGVARSFKAGVPGDPEIAQLERLISIKFLENLGVLDHRSSEIKKLQQMTSVADGFMDTVRQEYFEYKVLKYEGNETYDLNRFDDFSRMIWFLIPGGIDGSGQIRAMASTNVSNLNYLIYNPWEFDPGIFASFSGRYRHNFLMGHRRHDDMVLRWWPEYVSPDHQLKILLDEATRQRASTGQLTVADGVYRYEKQRFSNKDMVVFAGISTSSPDMLFGLLARVFPLLLLVFAILSLLLFADALAALFISPVKGISAGAAAVAAGDYSARIEIEKTDEFSLLTASFNEMTAGLAQREKMRRFVSENLYDRLGTATGLNELRSMQTSRVTMLASDIRSFTTLSEQYDPQQVVSLLNDYFTAMETAIKTHDGVIERFVGDAVMAVFYGRGEKAAEASAAAAAMAMRRQLAALNDHRAAQGLFTVENGIGIASGEAVSGMVGREGGRMVFAVLGEVAQCAERLESLTKTIESRILVCSETRQALGKGFQFGVTLGADGIQGFELLSRTHPEVDNG